MSVRMPTSRVPSRAMFRALMSRRCLGYGFVLTILCFMVSSASAGVARAVSPTIVTLTFDDNLANQYQVRSTLSSHGMHATFFVNSGRIGTSGYLTVSQLQALQGDGNEIAGHTVHHVDLTAVDTSEQERQVCDDRSTLLGWGLNATDFAYPFGAANPAIESVVRACGYDAARGLGGLSCAGCPPAETVPPGDAYLIRTPDAILSSTSLSAIEAEVTNAEQAGGGWVTLVMHNVCTGCGTYAITPSTLSSLLDWLSGQGSAGVAVETVHEVIGGQAQPAVAGPPPPPPITSGQMLQNPSLEADTNSDGLADCWKQDAYGTNTATWSRTTDAHTGSFAERIDVSSYSSGAVRLESQRDMGYCAPSVTPGHTYKASVWYKGTAQPQLVAFYRTSIGTFKALGNSNLFPKRSGWTQATWTLPSIRSTATGIELGVAVLSPGSVTVDDFSLNDASP
jgi:peptidoglycan/xylan/chitin deacetylase (PgdA/CDA1 family)